MIDSNIIKTLLEAEIIKTLKASEDAIDIMVKAALSKPVDAATGGPDKGYGKAVPYLEWVAGEIIRQAASASIRKIILEKEDEIDAEVRKRLSSEEISNLMVKSFLAATNSDWRIKVNFESDKS